MMYLLFDLIYGGNRADVIELLAGVTRAYTEPAKLIGYCGS